MPLIIETVVTTLDAEGAPHIAPLGLIAEGERWVIAPFKPSRTLDNLRTHPFAAASHPADVRVFAGCVTGRKAWPIVPTDRIAGVRLRDAVTHWEFQVESATEEEGARPRFSCRRVHEASHRAWGGYNRAQAAVLELAVLVTRLGMLPPEKIENELAYLSIAISKTAGPSEMEAWGWLMEKVDAWRAATAAGPG